MARAHDDQDMAAEELHDWDAEAEEMDEEFRRADCQEVEFGSDDDMPEDSDGEMDHGGDEEIGVVKENEIYDDEEIQQSGVDDSLTSVAHQESVLSTALSPTDWSLLATGGQDDCAVLWQVEEQGGAMSCRQRFRLEGHSDSVIQVAFSNDGKYVATGSYDGTVRIWQPEDGALVHALDGPSKEVEWISWHPKGHAILAGSTDTMAWMWWAPTGKLMQIFAGHAQSVTCGCWPMGGKLVCTASEDRGIIVWDPRTGAPKHHAKQVHEGAIVSICAHPEGPVVVSGGEDAIAKVVHIENGNTLAVLRGHSESVEALGFSNPGPNAMLLLVTASMDGKVNVWDGKTFELRCALDEHLNQGGVVRFKWLPPPVYGSWLSTCATDGTVRLFDALAGHCVRTLRGHTDTVLDVAVALGPAVEGPAGDHKLRIASGSDDKTCRLFSVALWTAGSQEAPQQGGPAAGAGLPLQAQAAVPATVIGSALPASPAMGMSPSGMV
jgi:ribosome assembly protein SQT1